MTQVASAASAAAARISAVLSDAQFFESGMVPEEDIRRQLDSTVLKDKLDAMKRVVALISLGKDASKFFADVVKNVVTSSLEIKKLVYLYLVRYAEENPDLALLSINSFQKDLSDPSQVIRCLSLRVLSSIRVKVILQIVIQAITKSSKDSSPYVRRAAAHAIAKVCQLDPSSLESLVEPLQTLLNDRSLHVLGSAVAALHEAAPDRLDLLHPRFRRLCRSLTEMDPWSQIACISVLMRYVRLHFPNPYPNANAYLTSAPSRDGTEEGKTMSPKGFDEIFDSVDQKRAISEQESFYEQGEEDVAAPPDIKLLLSSAEPLFMAHNSCVVLSAVSLYYHLGSRGQFSTKALPAVIRLVMGDSGTSISALNTILLIAHSYADALLEYLSLFYLSAADSKSVRELKLSILIAIIQSSDIAKKPHSLTSLLLELRCYLLSTDKNAASHAARAIGMLATSYPPSVSSIVCLLASTAAKSTQGTVTAEVVRVLTKLLERHPQAHSLALPQLVHLVLHPSGTQAPAARAGIVYLLSEFYRSVPKAAPEVLRLLTKSFPDEHGSVRMMTINLAAKLYCYALKDAGDDETNTDVVVRKKILDYVTSMGLQDLDYDLRDYSRLVRASLLPSPSSPASLEHISELVKNALISRKPVSSKDTASNPFERVHRKEVLLGSLDHIIGKTLAGGRVLPEWADSVIGGELRNEPEGDSQGVSRGLEAVSSADYYNASDYLEGTGVSHAWGRQDVKEIGKLENQSYVTGSRALNFQRVDPDTFYSDADTKSSSSASCETDSATSEDIKITPRTKEENAKATRSVEPVTTKDFFDLDNLLDQSSSSASKNFTASGSGSKASGPTVSYRPDSSSPSHDWVSDLSRLQVAEPQASAVDWHRALESWKGEGIQADYAFTRNAVQSHPNLTMLFLRFQNCSKLPLSRTVSSSSPQVKIQSPSTFSLGVREVIEMIIHVEFQGRVTPLSFVVGEGLAFTIRPEIGQVIRPYLCLTISEYSALEDKLQGMLGSESVVSVSLQSPRAIRSTVSRAAYLSEIYGPDGIASRVIGRWAGWLPRKADAPVLLKIEELVKNADGQITLRLWVGCEDVLFGANLLQSMKSVLATR